MKTEAVKVQFSDVDCVSVSVIWIPTVVRSLLFYHCCRWFQNSKVQKVVKDSKMLSKVRTSIKVKLNKPVVDLNVVDESAVPGGNPSTDGKTEAGGSTDQSHPNVIGSMEEYAKIVGKSVKAIQVKLSLFLFVFVGFFDLKRQNIN